MVVTGGSEMEVLNLLELVFHQVEIDSKVHKYKSKMLEIFIGKTHTCGLSTIYIMHYNSLSEQLKISQLQLYSSMR